MHYVVDCELMMGAGLVSLREFLLKEAGLSYLVRSDCRDEGGEDMLHLCPRLRGNAKSEGQGALDKILGENREKFICVPLFPSVKELL